MIISGQKHKMSEEKEDKGDFLINSLKKGIKKDNKDKRETVKKISTSKTLPVFYDKNASIVIEKDDIGENFYLGENQSHHISVLRLKKNDLINVVDGRGKRILSKIVNITKNRVDFEVQDVFVEKRPYPRIGLVVPIINEDRFEQILEVATEMQVSYIVPWQANRSESKKLKKNPTQLAKLYARWNTKVIASVNQSRSSFVPIIKEIIDSGSLEDRITDLVLSKSSKVFLFHENAEKFFVEELEESKKAPKRVSFIIGPEGSFDKEELKSFINAGAIPVKLTKNILRVGTAIYAALSYIRLSFYKN